MPKKKESTVNDQSYWVCRHCGDEVLWQDDFWRSTELSRYQGNWLCDSKVEENVQRSPTVPDNAILTLRPGIENYYHDGQEIDPAADLMRIISEL